AEKSFVTSAGHADSYVVSTRPDGAESPIGSSLYLVPASASGIDLGDPWTGLGLRGNASAPMTFETDTADASVIGEPGKGLDLMLGVVLPWFQLGQGAVALGIAEAAMSAAVDHVTGARLEHLDQTLADLPTVRARIGRAQTEVDTVAGFLTDVARRMGEGDPQVPILSAKASANEMAIRVTSEAMQACGGAALSTRLPIERGFRDARAGAGMGPTPPRPGGICQGPDHRRPLRAHGSCPRRHAPDVMAAGMKPILVGAVAYDQKVVPIWEGIRDYFRGSEIEMDVVWFSNYEAQVAALLAGWIDVAWNTNLAYVRVDRVTHGACTVLAMRDTDVGFRTLLVGRADELGRPSDLKGKRLALGSADSAQAAIMPVHYLRREGLAPGDDIELVRFDSDVGKHGDTGRSERDAIQAVLAGDADAAAVGAASWDALVRAGEVPPATLAPFWTSPPYNHCNFTALPSLDAERADAWTAHLRAMDWANPQHRRILELEGLREWIAPDLGGYADVFDAVEEQGIAARWC